MSLRRLSASIVLLFMACAVLFFVSGCSTIESTFNSGKTETLARYGTLKLIGNQEDPAAAATEIVRVADDLLARIDSGEITAAASLSAAFNRQFDISKLDAADQFIVFELLRIAQESLDRPEVEIIEGDALISVKRFIEAVAENARFAQMVYSK